MRHCEEQQRKEAVGASQILWTVGESQQYVCETAGDGIVGTMRLSFADAGAEGLGRGGPLKA
jgi:hypothetical protein